MTDPSARGPGAEAHRAPPPILVADDDPSAVALIVRYLEAMGLVNPVVSAMRGDQAIRVLDDAAFSPAFVVLDIQMPGASGLEILRWLRSREEYLALPVLILTGSSDLDVVDQAYDLGAVHYLVKPVGFDALDDVLHRLRLPWAVFGPDVGAG